MTRIVLKTKRSVFESPDRRLIHNELVIAASHFRKRTSAFQISRLSKSALNGNFFIVVETLIFVSQLTK